MDGLLEMTDLFDQQAARLRSGFDGVEIGMPLHRDGTAAKKKSGQIIGKCVNTRSGSSGNKIGVTQPSRHESFFQKQERLFPRKSHDNAPVVRIESRFRRNSRRALH